jgi:hypothetical protein
MVLAAPRGELTELDDILSFMIEMEERGLLTVPPSRVIPPEPTPEPPRRGKKAARAKRQRATT